MLFTYRVYVDDRRLGRSLAALQGLATQIDAPQPVRNAIPTPQGLKSTAKNNMLDIKLPPAGSLITPKDVQQMLADAGFSPGSSNYLINRLITQKLLAKTPKHGVYKVRSPGDAQKKSPSHTKKQAKQGK